MEQIWQFRETGQYGSFRSGGGAGLIIGDRPAAPSMPQSTSTSDTSRIPTIFPRTPLAARRPPPAYRFAPHHTPVGGRSCPHGTALRCTVSAWVVSSFLTLQHFPRKNVGPNASKFAKDETPDRHQHGRLAQRARTCRKGAHQQCDRMCTGQTCQQYAQCHLLATCCGVGFTSSTPDARAGSNGAAEGAF